MRMSSLYVAMYTSAHVICHKCLLLVLALCHGHPVLKCATCQLALMLQVVCLQLLDAVRACMRGHQMLTSLKLNMAVCQ